MTTGWVKSDGPERHSVALSRLSCHVVAGALVLSVSVLSFLFFPPRSLLSYLTRTSRVRFFFPRSAGSSKLVCLTIDDAPSAGTGEVLDVLRAYGVRATFFLIGSYGATHPTTVERIAADGHELANHDWIDRRSVAVPLHELIEDVARTERVIGTVQERAQWFRPGAGAYTGTMVEAMAQSGYETVLADVYSHDIRVRHPGVIYQHMRLRVTNGSVMLLHDGSVERTKRTAQVLKRLLPDLQAQGYQFVTLTEMKEACASARW
jgi:peptidoglycan/xylan/chitin deacetylase (PgdA/CDA1 family)